MENLHQVALVGACLLLLSCRSALLVKPSARLWPLQLSLPIGATAVFTCNISNLFVSDYGLDWYKFDRNGQPERLDRDHKPKKYSIITQLNFRTSEMKILNVEKNDSGIYYCMLLALSLNNAVTESNKANLTVTEKAPESELQEEEKEEQDTKNDENGHPDHSIPFAATGGAGLVLVLAGLCFFLACIIKRRKEQEKSHDENAPLEEEPRGVSVFTVDYGVLEFHEAENARRAPPPKRSPSDRTEYATIIFPQQRPVSTEADKRTRKPRSCPGTARPH